MDKIDREKIRNFIARNYHIDKKEVSDEASLIKAGIIDSMGIVEMINFVEKEFNITVDDSEIEAENFEKLNSITSYIEKKLASKDAKENDVRNRKD